MADTEMLNDFAATRFSPTRYDASHVISEQQVDLLLEAARRAPSAGNSQPWSFIVGLRGDGVHARLVHHLARSSATWAPDAGLLIANLAQLAVPGTDLEYSEFSHYDLGQAVAHLTFQAHALGLGVHQFRAFDRDGIAAEFAVPEHLEVTSIAAIGVPLGSPDTHAGAGTSRERRSRAEITWTAERPGMCGSDSTAG